MQNNLKLRQPPSPHSALQGTLIVTIHFGPASNSAFCVNACNWTGRSVKPALQWPCVARQSMRLTNSPIGAAHCVVMGSGVWRMYAGMPVEGHCRSAIDPLSRLRLDAIYWVGRKAAGGLAMDEPYLMDAAIAAIYQLIDTEGLALFGALLGTLLVNAVRDRFITVSRKRLSGGKQLLLVFLTLGVGYLFEPLLLSLAPMLSRGMAAFAAAVVVIPITLKVLVWLDSVDLRELVQRWRRRD